MPISIPLTFTQTDTSFELDLELPLSASTSIIATPDFVVTPLYLKLSAPPALLTIDLAHPIDPHTATLKRHPHTNTSRPHYTLHCTKQAPATWQQLEWKGTRVEREERRREALRWWEEDEARRKAERVEQRRLERKEDREKGWEWQRSQKDQIVAAKGRERVVALDDLKSWQQQQSSSNRGEVWEAKTGETIEVLEDDHVQEEKFEEHKYSTEEDKTETLAPQPQQPAIVAHTRSSAPAPPIRSTTRLTTTFTAVHPTLPSLPARESNAPKADLTAPATDVLANLLQLKDKADAFYRRRDLASAVAAYTQLLDEREVRQRDGGGEGGWRYGWVVGRVLSNRSACYLALATRTGVAALAQQLVNVQRAEEDAVEALHVLGGLKDGEASTEERRALDEKLRKRLVALYTMQGKWDLALPHAQAAGLKEDVEAINQNLQAVKAGEDTTALSEAEQLLSRSPALLSAALRKLDTALTLSPLSLQALQLRVDVMGRLGEWDRAIRDAVLGTSLCERTQQPEQRLWWIGRRGECHLSLKQFSAAQADLTLLSSTAAPYTPLTAASLPALLAALSYQQRHHALAASLPALRAASQHAQLKSALAALLSLQSGGAVNDGSDEWMLGQAELVSEQGWCELRLGEYAACVATCGRARAMWEQWSARQRQTVEVGADVAVAVCDEEVQEEMSRVQANEERRRAQFEQRLSRWRLLTSVRKATALCYIGRLKDGRDEYMRVLDALHARRDQTGHVESENERLERQEIEADLAKIDAAIEAQQSTLKP